MANLLDIEAERRARPPRCDTWNSRGQGCQGCGAGDAGVVRVAASLELSESCPFPISTISARALAHRFTLSHPGRRNMFQPALHSVTPLRANDDGLVCGGLSVCTERPETTRKVRAQELINDDGQTL